jgi:hypothetical protein
MENIKKEELERTIFDYLKDNLLIKQYNHTKWIQNRYTNMIEKHDLIEANFYLIDPTSKEEYLLGKVEIDQKNT